MENIDIRGIVGDTLLPGKEGIKQIAEALRLQQQVEDAENGRLIPLYWDFSTVLRDRTSNIGGRTCGYAGCAIGLATLLWPDQCSRVEDPDVEDLRANLDAIFDALGWLRDPLYQPQWSGMCVPAYIPAEETFTAETMKTYWVQNAFGMRGISPYYETSCHDVKASEVAERLEYLLAQGFLD